MKNAMLLSCFLIIFSLGCVGSTGFLIDESQKRTLKDIDKLLLVIELESSYDSVTRKAHYKKLDLDYVKRYAKDILEKASGIEVVYTDNKETDKSFVLIKIESTPYCDSNNFAGYRCPGGQVSGDISLYQKGEKIFFDWFFHKEPIKERYYGFPPNVGEEYALRRSKDFINILEKIGFGIRKYSSKQKWGTFVQNVHCQCKLCKNVPHYGCGPGRRGCHCRDSKAYGPPKYIYPQIDIG